MSAIAGIYHSNNAPVTRDHYSIIMDNLAQFPANDIQCWNKNNAFLGCLSQWITPESIGEQLPFYDSERNVAITADAIIDNREELFTLLQVETGLRKTIPDSQLILLSYYKWEEDCPKYIIGDFAFMIWDERKQKLFGARDFSGTRTLYYYQDKKHFAFCTTIEALLNLPYIQKQLNEDWLSEFLAISSVVDTVNTSITPYTTIEQVPPAHSISVEGNRVKIKQYCTLLADSKLNLKSDNEYVEAFQEVFQKSVNSRLRTHHQVGAHLSGGLDSGSVVGFAARSLKNENKLLHTFSYIPVKDFKDYTPKRLLPDERPFIKETVNYIGGIKDHYLDFDGKDSYSEINEYLDILEMPYKFFENSFWIKGMFETANKKGIGVLLNGGRGNFTISWGHALNYYAILLKKMKWLKLYKELNQYSQNAGGARLRRIPVLAKVAFPKINKMSSSVTNNHFPRLINEDFAKRKDAFNKINKYGLDETGWFGTNDIFEQRKRHFEDIFHWHATNTLAAKLSLRYSLWKRDSTNDLRVIRFCLSVPEEQYVQNGMDRALIRRSTKNLLPDKVRLNQRIRGVQGADWVHRMTPIWDEFINDIKLMANDEKLLTFVDGEIIKQSIEKVAREPRPEYATDPNYRLLMRSLIVSKFIKRFA
ncbi:lasso peptide isopeptide bond-forming cyclase [Alkalihalobacillus sp. MEB130]|uniref:lasso peptide isopeptide bond-forming cyclase n=1 Tax=Alkalihalobacillus sp. MEB130 TaxID=2976704 RepID=UPI0028DDB28B|nr:lasso peptide isopeptide bond-forming cyclase [Alkalihalobacillus sp. MEB130]MDT8861087.1 lasso peptide isopeptide bond-forming cyclase [Alkalihalobacillus sp. MEB130]